MTNRIAPIIFTNPSHTQPGVEMVESFNNNPTFGIADNSIDEISCMVNEYFDQKENEKELKDFVIDENNLKISISELNLDGSKTEIFRATVENAQTNKVSFQMKLTDKSQPLLIDIMKQMKKPQIKSNLNINKAIELMNAVPKLNFTPAVLADLIKQVNEDKNRKPEDRQQLIDLINTRSPSAQPSEPNKHKL